MVEIKKIATLGVGLMGQGIAQVSLMAGYDVVLVDIKQEFVDKAFDGIMAGMKKLEEKGALPVKVKKTEDAPAIRYTAEEIMEKCTKSIDLASAVKDCDMVIEAVIEKMEIKKDVCKTTMDNGPDHILFCSNTSTMSITEIGKDSGKPAQVCGMHFFNPVPLMACIEVIRGEGTSDETFKTAMDVAKTLPVLRGRRYIAPVLKDRPGFIVNRLNAPANIYLSWAFDQALEKGILPDKPDMLDADIGKVAAMPPCVLSDYVGIDTLYHVMKYNEGALSPDFKPGKVLTDMYEKGLLGRKTGKGFYDWSAGRPKPDFSEKAGILDINLLFSINLNEGCRILEEGVASGTKTIDDANMAGMNTPGPFGWGKRNYEKAVELLNAFVDKSGIEYLRPCELLKSGGFKKMRK
ncbi:MAG: 3-hydroxyacyl-CoA dehydrogenase NAD-binding domain-containing protein [Promethearchaeota archaeon]